MQNGTVDHPSPVTVSCALDFEIAEGATLALQVAVARTAGAITGEELCASLDGAPVEGIEEVEVEHGGRVHTLSCGPGHLAVTYGATVEPARTVDARLTPAESIIARRQSRYCPSDAMEPFAIAELGDMVEGVERGRAVGEWVFQRLVYELGSSGPLDTAVDTLLTGRGVCRDFAHLTIALCRSIGVPARLVSAYAPGLSPMDFHAVAEVAVDGRWEVVDASRLAPRSSLVRIGTGRDAADNALVSTLEGWAELVSSSVFAVVEGDLPLDDHRGPIAIA